jgi:ATP-dependent DNA helicase PIF1
MNPVFFDIEYGGFRTTEGTLHSFPLNSTVVLINGMEMIVSFENLTRIDPRNGFQGMLMSPRVEWYQLADGRERYNTWGDTDGLFGWGDPIDQGDDILVDRLYEGMYTWNLLLSELTALTNFNRTTRDIIVLYTAWFWRISDEDENENYYRYSWSIRYPTYDDFVSLARVRELQRDFMYNPFHAPAANGWLMGSGATNFVVTLGDRLQASVYVNTIGRMGCGNNRKQVRYIPCMDGGTVTRFFRVIDGACPLESNDCAIVSILEGVKSVFKAKNSPDPIHEDVLKMTRTQVRTKLGFEKNVPLLWIHICEVAKFLGVHLELWSNNGAMINMYRNPRQNEATGPFPIIPIFTWDQHCALFDGIVCACDSCGEPMKIGHITSEGKCCRAPCPYCDRKHFHPDNCPKHPDRLNARIQQLNEARIEEQKFKRSRVLLNEQLSQMDFLQELTDEQVAPLQDCLGEGKSVMILGPGGVGKTHIAIRTMQRCCEIMGLTITIMATTGIAATHLPNARTVHSVFAISQYETKGDDKAYLRKIDGLSEERKQLLKADVIVIDEISMLTSDLVERMDLVLRHVRNPLKCFGGVRMVLVGDFMQLPPITDTDDMTERESGYVDWCFHAAPLQHMLYSEEKECPPLMRVYELTKPMRQKDPEWFECLQAVRNGTLESRHFDMLHARDFDLEAICYGQWCDNPFKDHFPILLTPFNARRKKHNDFMLRQFPTTRVFTSEDTCPNSKHLESLIEKTLTLAVGVRVMLLINDYMATKKIANGSLGTIVNFETDSISVRFDSISETVNLRRHTFTYGPGEARSQYPITVAYALTIHKSQGLSLEDAIIDLNYPITGFWGSNFGMAYVALSRLTSIRGLHLVRGWNNAVLGQRSKHVCDFLQHMLTTEYPRFFPPPVDLADSGMNESIVSTIHERPLHESVLHAKRRAKAPRFKEFSWKCQQKAIYFDGETYVSDVTTQKLHMYHITYYIVRKGLVEVHHLTEGENCACAITAFAAIVMNLVNQSVEAAKKRNKAEGPVFLAGGLSASTHPLLNWYKQPWYLCAYNGSNFDFQFFLQQLFHENSMKQYRISSLFRRTSIIQMTLRMRGKNSRPVLILHDLARFLVGTSLDKAAECFLGENRAKSFFPHKHLNWHPEHAKLVLRGAENQRLTRESFFKKDLMVFDEIKPNDRLAFFVKYFKSDQFLYDADGFVSLSNISLNDLMMSYVTQDVDIMYRLYQKMDEMVSTKMKASIMDFFSGNQLATYGLLAHLPARALYNPGDASEIISKLTRLDSLKDVFVTQALYGGRTLPRQYAFSSKNLSNPEFIENGFNIFPTDAWWNEIDALMFVDVCSMYVKAMRDFNYPYGESHWLSDTELKDMETWTLDQWRNSYCIVEIDACLHPLELEPPIPYREEKEGKIAWDVGRRTAIYSSIDVYLLLRNQGTLFSCKRGLRWREGGMIFSKWMNKTLQWKMEGEKTDNLALRSFGKLMGNSSYGGFAQKTPSTAVAHCFQESDFKHFWQTADWEGYIPCGDGAILYGHLQDFLGRESQSSKHLAAFVLAFSRLILDDFISALCPLRRSGTIEALQEQPYYGDTDSLIIHVRQLPRIKHLLGEEVGQWTDDLFKGWNQSEHCKPMPALIWRYVGLAPKSYGIEYTCPVEYTNHSMRAALSGGMFCLDTSDPLMDRESMMYKHVYKTKKEKVRFKGIDARGDLHDGNQILKTLTFSFLVNCYLRGYGLSFLPAPPSNLLPECVTDTLRRVGHSHTVLADRSFGIQPYDIRQTKLARTLFRTPYKGRKVVVYEIPTGINHLGRCQSVPKSVTCFDYDHSDPDMAWVTVPEMSERLNKERNVVIPEPMEILDHQPSVDVCSSPILFPDDSDLHDESDYGNDVGDEIDSIWNKKNLYYHQSHEPPRSFDFEIDDYDNDIRQDTMCT